jgi:hypothetical protein
LGLTDLWNTWKERGFHVTLFVWKFGGKKENTMSIIEKIKLLFAIKKPVTKLVNEAKQIKSGWKTWEFWVTIIGGLISVTAALTGFIPATTSLIISTALGVIYNIVRAFQNAGIDGTTPVMQSTRFIAMIAGFIYAGLMALKTGGIDPAWISSAIAILGAIGAAAQSLGAQQPTAPTEPEVKP